MLIPDQTVSLPRMRVQEPRRRVSQAGSSGETTQSDHRWNRSGSADARVRGLAYRRSESTPACPVRGESQLIHLNKCTGVAFQDKQTSHTHPTGGYLSAIQSNPRISPIYEPLVESTKSPHPGAEEGVGGRSSV